MTSAPKILSHDWGRVESKCPPCLKKKKIRARFVHSFNNMSRTMMWQAQGHTEMSKGMVPALRELLVLAGDTVTKSMRSYWIVTGALRE